jgi:hypothetical protein
MTNCAHPLAEVDVGHTVQRVHISELGGALGFATQFVAKNKPVIIEGDMTVRYPHPSSPALQHNIMFAIRTSH